MESLRWEIHRRLKKSLSAEGELPTGWNTSFARSIEQLASPSRRKITVERRLLGGLQECADHYPGKTLIANIRELRLALLPALNEMVDLALMGPRYGTAATENHYVRFLLDDDERAGLRRRWVAVKAGLKDAYSAAAHGERTVLSLIVNGASLFEKVSWSDRSSFHEVARTCLESGELPAPVADRLREFAQSFLPPDTVGALALRSYIHRFAHASRHGRYTLRDETKHFFRRMRKEYVESLPDFDDSPERFAREPKHSPLLDKLFDQSVFRSFQFVRLAGWPGEGPTAAVARSSSRRPGHRWRNIRRQDRSRQSRIAAPNFGA